jgi:hypothetical protein
MLQGRGPAAQWVPSANSDPQLALILICLKQNAIDAVLVTMRYYRCWTCRRGEYDRNIQTSKCVESVLDPDGRKRSLTSREGCSLRRKMEENPQFSGKVD